MFSFLKRTLQNPFALYGSLALGLAFGSHYRGESTPYIDLLATIYLNLLQFSVIPLVTTSIALAVANTFKDEKTKASLLKYVGISLAFIFLVSVIALLISYATAPGEGLALNENIVGAITAHQQDRVLKTTITVPLANADTSLIQFLANTVPKNIFHSLSQGTILQIIFIAIIFGAVMGKITANRSHPLKESMLLIYNIFQVIINGIILFLPIGLFFLMASQFAAINPESIYIVSKFVFVLLSCFFTFFFVCSLIIWRKSGLGYIDSVSKTKNAILVPLLTRSTFASIPPASEALHTNLQFPKTMVDAGLPFGIAIFRYGTVIYFCVVAIFLSGLYSTPLGWYKYPVIAVGAILASTAASGTVGVITIQMLGLVLEPLGLPIEAVIVLFISVDAIIEPFETLAIVYGNCAATTLSSHPAPVPR